MVVVYTSTINECEGEAKDFFIIQDEPENDNKEPNQSVFMKTQRVVL